jgi:hypothetical protein
MIEVFDNILNIDLANRYDIKVSKLKWSYEYQPVTPPLVNKHWYSDGKPFIDDMLKDLVDAIQLKGMDGQFDSSYLLGHTHGLEQQAHYDACDFTMIYYPKLDWQSEWGGGTLVGDTLVSYKGNRLLIFSCEQMHQGQPISKQCLELRPIVVYQCYAENAMIERLSWRTM